MVVRFATVHADWPSCGHDWAANEPSRFPQLDPRFRKVSTGMSGNRLSRTRILRMLVVRFDTDQLGGRLQASPVKAQVREEARTRRPRGNAPPASTRSALKAVWRPLLTLSVKDSSAVNDFWTGQHRGIRCTPGTLSPGAEWSRNSAN